MPNDTVPIPELHRTAPARASRAQRQAVLLWLVLLGPVIGLAHWLQPGTGVSGPALCAALFAVTGGAAVWAMRPLGYALPELGAPNLVTFLRLGMLCSLSVALVVPETLERSGLALFALALVALSLDGLDGWLARRQAMQSAFGARFDMEVDAALGCLLALILLAGGRAGPELLILGFSRYAFLAAGLLWGWLNAPLPERFGRKVVCVIQIGALCLLLLPDLPPVLARTVSLGVAGLLLWSFGRDIHYLARQR